jgi:hypothetical protein
MNNIVSFELAKKLKEVGFDESTKKVYIDDDYLYDLAYYEGDGSGLHKNSDNDFYVSVNPSNILFSAPDYFTVLLWLESKGIHVSWDYCEVTKNYTIVDDTHTMLFYDTLQECIEKLILISLKQLENGN